MFAIPSRSIEITTEELGALLSGIDLEQAARRKRYRRTATKLATPRSTERLAGNIEALRPVTPVKGMDSPACFAYIAAMG